MAYWRRSGVTAGNNTLYGTGAPDSAWESLLTEFGRLRLNAVYRNRTAFLRTFAPEFATKAGDKWPMIIVMKRQK